MNTQGMTPTAPASCAGKDKRPGGAGERRAISGIEQPAKGHSMSSGNLQVAFRPHLLLLLLLMMMMMMM
eukprot:766074-Hanusia_phi.AAC.3